MNHIARLTRLFSPGLPAADRALIAGLRAEGLTYLADARFASMARELRRIDKDEVAGEVLEFGVAGGGSAVFLARRARPGRRFMGFDLFGMIPPPGPQDPPEAHARHAEITAGRSQGLNGKPYYGYVDDLLGQVSNVLEQHGTPVDGAGVVLVPGLFEHTVPDRLPDRIALAHIDCDWFDPVLRCLHGVAPRMQRGAAVVLDDYSDWEGCRRAADEFLAENKNFRLIQARPNAVIRRIA